MKKLIAWVIVIALATLIYQYGPFPKSICDRTLGYTVGQFDDKFGISQEQFLDAVQKAEMIWEKPTGFDLFEHKEKSSFKINLVFDERQEYANRQSGLATQIESNKANYDRLVSQYNQKLKDYEARLQKYNDEVSFWNSKGGAPKEEFERLEMQRRELNQMATELNSLTNQLNKLAATLNLKVETFNVGAGRVFDQGQYTGDAITIYQFDDRNDLALILAHELGHALQLDHVDDAKAVMYFLKKDQDPQDIKLTDTDINALETQCQKPYLADPQTWQEFAVRLRAGLL